MPVGFAIRAKQALCLLPKDNSASAHLVYQYDHWRSVFYPGTLPKKDWFAFYAEHFDTVEINNTFYGLPRAETFDIWRTQAPPGFCYVLKFSRYGSHLKRLKEPRAMIKIFWQHARRLRTTLGPILVQLPPHWDVNIDRLLGFLNAASRSFRWAFEFRDRRWLCEDVILHLQNHNAPCVFTHDRRSSAAHYASWTYYVFTAIIIAGATAAFPETTGAVDQATARRWQRCFCLLQQ